MNVCVWRCFLEVECNVCLFLEVDVSLRGLVVVFVEKREREKGWSQATRQKFVVSAKLYHRALV